MTDDNRTGLNKGADEYARRHPNRTPTSEGQQPTGNAAAGRSAYKRRHGTRTNQNG